MNSLVPPPSTLPAGSKVWIYVRDRNSEAPDPTVPGQRAVLEAYCRQHELEITQVFEDIGDEERNQAALMELMGKSFQPDLRPDGLVILSSSRLSRNAVDLALYHLLLQRNRVKTHVISEPDCFTSNEKGGDCPCCFFQFLSG